MAPLLRLVALAAALRGAGAIVGSALFSLPAGADVQLTQPVRRASPGERYARNLPRSDSPTASEPSRTPPRLQFAFAAGGTVSLSVAVYAADGSHLNASAIAASAPAGGIFFFGCEPDTANTVASLLGGPVSDCLVGVAYARTHCQVPPVAASDGEAITLSVPSTVTLALVFLNCGAKEVGGVSADFVLLNPGGQNLPTTQAPLPPLYIAFGCAWVAAAVAFAAGSAAYPSPNGCASLRAALLSVPLLHAASAGASAAKWSALSATGTDNPVLDFAVVVAVTVSQVDLLGVTLLLSRGWFVSRIALGAPERHSIMLVLMALAALYFVALLFSPRSVFALALCYLVVLAFALSSVSHGLRHLRAADQILRLSDPVDAESRGGAGAHAHLESTNVDRRRAAAAAAASVRVAMFSCFSSVLVVFICVQVVLHLVAFFAPGRQSQTWLNLLWSELADLFYGLAVGWLFRPRRDSPFITDDSVGALRSAAGALIDGHAAAPSDEELAHAIATLAAREAADSAAAAAAMVSRARAASAAASRGAVLVEHPCATGMSVGMVSLGGGGGSGGSGGGSSPSHATPSPGRAHFTRAHSLSAHVAAAAPGGDGGSGGGDDGAGGGHASGWDAQPAADDGDAGAASFWPVMRPFRHQQAQQPHGGGAAVEAYAPPLSAPHAHALAYAHAVQLARSHAAAAAAAAQEAQEPPPHHPHPPPPPPLSPGASLQASLAAAPSSPPPSPPPLALPGWPYSPQSFVSNPLASVPSLLRAGESGGSPFGSPPPRATPDDFRRLWGAPGM